MILRAAHDLSSGREHSALIGVIHIHLSTRAAIRMHLVSRLLNFTILLGFVTTSHPLASGTEEAFHTVEIYDSIGTLLLFLLNCMHLILLVRHSTSVVTEPSLSLGTCT